MKLLQANNDPTKYAKVDDDVFETIEQMNLKFWVNKDGYWRSTSHSIKLPGMDEEKQLYLHRFVFILKTGIESSLSIDHYDLNPSNNQYSNLRLATYKDQSQHRGKQKNNTSGYIGVRHCHLNKKSKNGGNHYWQARIRRPDGMCEVKLFSFTDEGKISAASWRDSKVLEYFSNFAGQLNFPTSSDNN